MCKVNKVSPDKIYIIHSNGSFSVVDTINVEPIPLTEDTLLKLGFELIDSGQPQEHEDYHEWLEKDYPIFGCVYQGDGDYVFWENNDNLRIYYLHQLQNLYFTITGRELELK